MSRTVDSQTVKHSSCEPIRVREMEGPAWNVSLFVNHSIRERLDVMSHCWFLADEAELNRKLGLLRAALGIERTTASVVRPLADEQAQSHGSLTSCGESV
jgi:hypothetical protein